MDADATHVSFGGILHGDDKNKDTEGKSNNQHNKKLSLGL